MTDPDKEIQVSQPQEPGDDSNGGGKNSLRDESDVARTVEAIRADEDAAVKAEKPTSRRSASAK